MKIYPFNVVPQRVNMLGLYRIDVTWDYLESALDSYQRHYVLDLNPEFQRGHVWTLKQQISYIEYILSGGISGKDIYLNCPNWQSSASVGSRIVCVDGLQRLTAARGFLSDKFKIFGKYYASNFKRLPHRAGFKFNINDLVAYSDILRWYLEMNGGGTPHTKKELDCVRHLLAKSQL